MATIELFLTGDQIGTYDRLVVKGNSNGTQVQVKGAQPLGTSEDVFRVVIRQVSDGDDAFENGQFVDIYAYPGDPGDPPLYSSLNPQHDQFQGRASSGEHQIFTNPAKIIFDVNGIPTGDYRYGPGFNPPRSEKLSFDAFSDTPPTVPCFTPGTLLQTDTGPLPVECLKAGDRLVTRDAGPQPIRWIGRRTVPGTGPYAPVEIGAGVLGNLRPLRVSPQHRFLIEGWQAEMLYGEAEVFASAIHLVDGERIRQVPCRSVTYIHVMLDAHHVIFAEGAPTESLHLGDMVVDGLPSQARAEIVALFPELGEHGPMRTARTCLRRWETAALLA